MNKTELRTTFLSLMGWVGVAIAIDTVVSYVANLQPAAGSTPPSLATTQTASRLLH